MVAAIPADSPYINLLHPSPFVHFLSWVGRPVLVIIGAYTLANRMHNLSLATVSRLESNLPGVLHLKELLQ